MEKQPDIRIFIACHKPTYVPENPIFYPVQVGTALTEKRLEHMAYRDNEGDNISGKNPDYCELTAQYWAWKNIDCDYYGFFHYRRYLTFHRVCSVMASGRILGKRQHPYIELDSVWDDLTPYWMEAEWMVQQIAKYDLLTVYRERINTTVYRQYCQYHEAEELNHMLEIVNRVYPEYTDSAKAYMSSKDIYYMNMYIMKKELFHTYMEWLFTLLDTFEQERKEINKPQEPRLYGYLAERLFGIFYFYQRKKGIQCAELPYLKFYHTEPGKEEEVSNIREFRLKPTNLKIKIDMRKLNRLFPAGSFRRVLLRGFFFGNKSKIEEMRKRYEFVLKTTGRILQIPLPDAAACHKRHQAEIPPELSGVSLEYSESADGYGYHGNCILQYVSGRNITNFPGIPDYRTDSL